MNDEDALLMCRVRDGDDEAFAELFARWRVAMVRFAVRFVGNQDRGEELAQDVFLKIYRARARYVPREAFRAYIFRVATNHCLNEVRRAEYRSPRIAVEEMAQEPADEHGISAEELVQADRVQQAVRAAVVALPPQQRAALLLQREQGLGLADIAETLETTVSAVKSLLTRARRSLTESLAPLMEIARTGDLPASSVAHAEVR